MPNFSRFVNNGKVDFCALFQHSVAAIYTHRVSLLVLYWLAPVANKSACSKRRNSSFFKIWQKISLFFSIPKFFGAQIIFEPVCAMDRIVPLQGYRYIPVRAKSASQNLRNSTLYHKDLFEIHCDDPKKKPPATETGSISCRSKGTKQLCYIPPFM